VSELTKKKNFPLKQQKQLITSLMDYSLNSIETSLEAYAKKRRERESTTLNELEVEVEVEEDLICKYNHDLIMTSLDMESSTTSSSTRLIGDRSRAHILPCIQSVKHADLNVIEPSTLTQVLDGRYDTQIDRVIVIDSRYPYEYDGGHIRSAQNVYTKEKLLDVFLSDQATTCQTMSGRTIIIFHCEFSSERGPNLLRFLRNQDRAANRDAYPKLFYPELYLLEGGYKAFYETHENYCEPKMYKPMLHADHAQDLKHFRAKTKTWEHQHKHYNAMVTATGFRTSLQARTSSSNNANAMRKNNLGRLQRFPKSTLF
jgi:rhodanese-related sulfurtransferase